MRKPDVQPPELGAPNRDTIIQIIEHLNIISGRKGKKITKLDPAVAQLQDVVNKLNEIIDLLQ